MKEEKTKEEEHTDLRIEGLLHREKEVDIEIDGVSPHCESRGIVLQSKANAADLTDGMGSS